jgi:hypothetical protein
MFQMETLVGNAMAGWPDYAYEPEDPEEERRDPLLEQFPDQARLKRYLLMHQMLRFKPDVMIGGQLFRVLGPRGNLTWCCLPSCDRVIVDGPLSLFLDEGRRGEITLHWACFEMLVQRGILALRSSKVAGNS